jgi:hypothetical protein
MPPFEVRLTVAKKQARLTLTNGDDVIEDELWKFDSPATSSEAADIARPNAVFCSWRVTKSNTTARFPWLYQPTETTRHR